jgi:hypothetical protein
MNRVRGHRYAGPIPGRLEERHWVAGIIALAGTLVGVGGSVGMSFLSAGMQPSGKPNAGQRKAMEEAAGRQEQAFQLQQMLQPFLLEQMGLQATYGPNGQVTSVTKRPQTEAERQRGEIETLANAKVLKGLRGELDIDPATERTLARDDRIMQEKLARTQGQSGDVSTTSQTATNLQRESDRIIREAVRRGEMTDAQAIATSEANQNFRQEQYRSGLAAGLPGAMQGLNLSGVDYAGLAARQNFLSGTLNANRYGAYGNIIGQGVPGLGNAISKFFPQRPVVPPPTMQTPGGDIIRGPYGAPEPINIGSIGSAGEGF